MKLDYLEGINGAVSPDTIMGTFRDWAMERYGLDAEDPQLFRDGWALREAAMASPRVARLMEHLIGCATPLTDESIADYPEETQHEIKHDAKVTVRRKRK